MSTPANRKRAIERQNCRLQLALHIEEKLGLKIDPLNIRLQPIEKDGYQWKFDSLRGYLFNKPLSDLSTNDYIELVEHLRIGNIQVIKKEHNHNSTSNSLIDKLEEEIQDLRGELQESQRLQATQLIEIKQLQNTNQLYMGKFRKIKLAHRKAQIQIQGFLEMMNSMNE